jgi:hypothetical protein
MSFNWKSEDDNYVGEQGHLSLNKRLSSADRTKILDISYTLSPSGRALYEAMIAVVSERLSQQEAPILDKKSGPKQLNSESGN